MNIGREIQQEGLSHQSLISGKVLSEINPVMQKSMQRSMQK